MKIGKIEICCGIFIGLHSDFLDEDMAILPTGPSKWPPLYGSMGWHFLSSFVFKKIWTLIYSRVTLHTARHLHTAVPPLCDIFTGEPPHSQAFAYSRAPLFTQPCPHCVIYSRVTLHTAGHLHTAVPPLCDIFERVNLHTAGHLHTAVPHCSHCRAPIVHTAVPRENNEHGLVYLRCRAVCKLPGCVEGHPWYWEFSPLDGILHNSQ